MYNDKVRQWSKSRWSRAAATAGRLPLITSTPLTQTNTCHRPLLGEGAFPQFPLTKCPPTRPNVRRRRLSGQLCPTAAPEPNYRDGRNGKITARIKTRVRHTRRGSTRFVGH